MKLQLLGWMHQKLRQRSAETFKDFTIGNSCTSLSGKLSLSDQDFPTEPSFSSRHCSKSLKQQEREYDKSVSEFEANGVEENLVISESFSGFLSIGTFGSEPIISEPETPTFATLTTLKEKAPKINPEAVENDLKFIIQKIEKLHDDDAKEEEHSESSGMNTHENRSGHQIEGVNAEDCGISVVCPQQGYLYGSSIELSETKTEVKKEKTSLAELFERAKIVDEKSKHGEMQNKRAQKSSMHRMKKMLKKLCVSSERFSHSISGVSTMKNKLQKVKTILHKKVHPENSAAAGEFAKHYRNKNGNILPNSHCKNMHPDGENSSLPWAPNNLNLPQYRVVRSITSKNREHWIKTDADYLVLEL